MKKYNGMTLTEWIKEAAMAVVICVALGGIVWMCAALDEALRY